MDDEHLGSVIGPQIQALLRTSRLSTGGPAGKGGGNAEAAGADGASGATVANGAAAAAADAAARALFSSTSDLILLASALLSMACAVA